MYYSDVLSGLAEDKIDYLIAGGLALNFYGVPRVTYDIDLMISVEPENVQKMVALFARLGYEIRLPLDPLLISDPEQVRLWIEQKNLRAISFYHKKEGFKEADLLIHRLGQFQEMFGRKKILQLDGVEVYIVSLDDLIDMKKEANRSKDLADIEMLLEVKDIMEAGDVDQ